MAILTPKDRIRIAAAAATKVSGQNRPSLPQPAKAAMINAKPASWPPRKK